MAIVLYEGNLIHVLPWLVLSNEIPLDDRTPSTLGLPPRTMTRFMIWLKSSDQGLLLFRRQSLI